VTFDCTVLSSYAALLMLPLRATVKNSLRSPASTLRRRAIDHRRNMNSFLDGEQGTSETPRAEQTRSACCSGQRERIPNVLAIM
jgi:hypothetical protein